MPAAKPGPKPKPPLPQQEYDAALSRACKVVEGLAKVVVAMPVAASPGNAARLRLLGEMLGEVVDTLRDWT